MRTILAALAAGLVFGLGLTVSQMIDPAKVLGFLDFAGDWDPSLALVMAGALVVTAVGNRFVFAGRGPLFAQTFQLPTRRDIDARLVGGGALFGIGWGLAGLCPGPAVTSIAYLQTETLYFLPAMLAGLFLVRRMT